jgi:ribosomal-protein-alanine N-acetyltransferase
MLLSVDSSSERLIMGIAEPGRIIAEFNGPPDRSHSEKIIPELDNMLTGAGIAGEALDSMAVVTGPGSFTGLRVGISALLGLAASWNKSIVGARTQFIHKLLLEKRNQDALTVIHCRADQFFLSTDGEEIQLLSATDILDHYGEREFAGPGAQRLAEVITTAGGKTLMVADPPSYSGGELALIFAENTQHFDPLDPDDLKINYQVKSQPERLRDQSKKKFKIAAMAESDLDDIMRIETESFTDAWRRESFEHDIRSRWVITLAVRQRDRCIGYANCLAVDDYGYLANIAVDPKARGQGVGKALIKEICRRLRKSGKQRLLLDVRPTNLGAIKFYEREGFSILVRRKDFYTNPVEDSYTMGLELDETD